MERTNEPQFLKDNKKCWTSDYKKTGRWNSNWHGYYPDLLRELKKTTKSHCAFCDEALMPVGGAPEEIEHLKPKSNYPLLAYVWINIFPCCTKCNRTKSNRFDALLLRPDATGFSFDKWFYFDFNSFEVLPKKIGNPNWIRAERTIKIFGLNKPEKIQRRAFFFNYPTKSMNIDDLAFRFMFSF